MAVQSGLKAVGNASETKIVGSVASCLGQFPFDNAVKKNAQMHTGVKIHILVEWQRCVV